jgi:hypothetical protein
MCAPRPVFISGGATQGDGWVDAKGMFLATAGADHVYRLLGAKGLGTNQFPSILTPLTTGALAFRQHDQGHTPAPNWPYFLDWGKELAELIGRVFRDRQVHRVRTHKRCHSLLLHEREHRSHSILAQRCGWVDAGGAARRPPNGPDCR